MSRIEVKAHAKINLNLKVLGKRPDGYHDLETVVQTVTLHDTVTLQVAEDGIALEVDDPSVPADCTNLAWLAASRLPRPRLAPRGVRIHLGKRIPSGAGLGGGSSDAAATLAGLNGLWDLRLPLSDLVSIAATVGSDAPFFLTGGTALLRGRGTEVQPLPDLGGYDLLVITSGVPISTRDVYAQVPVALTPARKTSSMTRFSPTLRGSLAGEVETWISAGNDLEPIARNLCPAIGEIKTRLLDAGATAAAMSGSGSSVFGVFRDRASLDRAVRVMRGSGYTVLACAPLCRQDSLKSLGLG
jgi:4-diphosphocytidyl-2-C-methyl-D-erythritol kinase